MVQASAETLNPSQACHFPSNMISRSLNSEELRGAIPGIVHRLDLDSIALRADLNIIKERTTVVPGSMNPSRRFVA
jgi:hypothetical protein